jgi:hypothetical protein
VSVFIQAIAINATMFGLFVCVDRYERNIRLSLVLKLALRRHLKSFNALRRHRCLDAPDEEIDPLHRLDSESIKALSKIKSLLRKGLHRG